MSAASRHVPREEGISVVLVRFDRVKYPGATEALTRHLDRLGQRLTQLVVVDNADPHAEAREVAPGVTVIGGDNSAWEFSAFDRGLEWLSARGQLHDVVLVVTDAFRAKGDDYLELVDRQIVEFVRRRRAVVGWIDSFGEPLELEGAHYEGWLRTSHCLLSSDVALAVQPFAWPVDRDRFFSGDWRSPWHPGAPLSDALASRLERWLVSSTVEADEQWHSAFVLSEATRPLFEAKASAILREHHLSLRLAQGQFETFDLRVIADRLLEGRPPADTDIGWPGLKRWLAAGDEARRPAGSKTASTPGRAADDEASGEEAARFLLDSSSGGASIAAARRFAVEVLPLVRQRYPEAVLTVAAAGSAASLRELIPFAEVVSAAPEPQAAVPGLVASLLPAGVAPSETGVSELPSLELSESAPDGSDIVATAARCCEVLEAWRCRRTEPKSPPPPVFETTAFGRREEYRRWRLQNSESYRERRRVETALAASGVPFLVDAWCVRCATTTPMHVDFEFGGDAEARRPNWRERLVCQRCATSCKVRGLLQVLRDVVGVGASGRVAIWELEDDLRTALEPSFPKATTWSDTSEGAGAGGRVRSGDVLVVVDMLERAVDLEKTMVSVIDRLHPGAVLVVAASFWTDRGLNRRRIGGRTTGVYREFGWEILDLLRESGLADVEAHFFWSKELGYLGTDQVVFTARRDER